jgi:transglutaminase-like putative cysteine protease
LIIFKLRGRVVAHILLIQIILSLTILEGKSLRDYALELPIASKPGYYIRNFVKEADRGLSPDKRVAKLYRKLLREWKYRNDPPGYDHFSNSEYLMRKNSLEGDCEDFASVLISICRVMNLRCQVALGIKESGSGHAWTEVFITDDKKLDLALYRRLKREFGSSARFVYRSNGFWLQLNPEDVIEKYKTHYVIDIDGNLRNIRVEKRE